MSLTDNCRHIVKCTNHHTNYSPAVETRNSNRRYSSDKKAGRAVSGGLFTTYYYELTLQSLCKEHRGKATGSSFPLIKTGDTITASVIKDLADAIDAELKNRGKDAYFVGDNAKLIPKRGGTTLPLIIAKLNSAFSDNGLGSTGGTNPKTGDIMTADNDPNPAIRKLNSLASECLCYTDCGGYSLCSCYGYCGHY